MTIPLLHGPALANAKPKPGAPLKPPTWPIAFRVRAHQIDGVEKLAKLHNCSKADVVRTAIAEFLEKYLHAADANSANSHADTSKPILAAPATAQPYRNEHADMRELRRVKAATDLRKASGKAGERLVDKTAVR